MLAEVTNAGAEMNTPCGGGAAVATTSLSSSTVADASPAKRAAIAPFQRLALIVAMTPEGGIGKDGTMPWTGLRTDMRRFKELTVGGGNNAVVMGRKTWASIPAKFRPLPGRRNIVLSANPAARTAHGIPEGVEVVPDFAAVEKCLDGVDTCFIIGGGGVYAKALESGNCETIYATEIATAGIAADTFFKFDKAAFDCVSTSEPVGEKGLEYRFVEYKCKPAGAVAAPAIPAAAPAILAAAPAAAAEAPNHEENQYLDLIRKILAEGVTRGDRTGTGTISVFGAQMRFSLRNNVMPLLTTKRTFWRGLAEELVWFVSGSTNANELAAKNINIWNGNGSREFLDGRGLSHREVGDLGPVYGYQWRHFGGEYKDMHADYSGKGVDQLAEVIRTIKTNPESRRIIMSAWNPADLPAMALPPCHMFAQFYVANGELSCQMYQRSADMGLGVPFNIASYALLTRMIAHCCDLKPGEFVHTIGDAHVYLNHVEPLKRQLTRTPFPFPRLEITCATKNIDEIRFEDFKLEGYQCHKGIKMKMAV